MTIIRGCIIVGYQGVGKSSCAGKDNCIDLESSNFKLDDGSRTPDWYKTYCFIAVDLAEQGYNVFVSSHEEVREYLRNYYDRVAVFFKDGLSMENENHWCVRDLTILNFQRTPLVSKT